MGYDPRKRADIGFITELFKWLWKGVVKLFSKCKRDR